MPRLSQLPPPASPLSGLELTPLLQGGGADGNVGLPILAYGNLPRGNVLALRAAMLADLSATADADPGAGNVRWNNATPSSATMLYVSDSTSDAGSLVTAFSALGLGGFVYVQRATDEGEPDARDTWQKWQVTSVADATGYTKVGVTLVDADGAFTDDDTLELTIQQPNPAAGFNRGVTTAVSSSSGTTTLDASLGDYFTTTMTENTTLAISNVPQACTLSLRITQASGTARTMAWPASFRWPTGHNKTISTALNARDRVVMTTDDYGATWDCALGKGHVA